MEKKLLNITQPSANKVRIEIDGAIGGFDWDDWKRKNTGSDIRKQLKEISKLEVDEIEVLITSLGGYVDDALQIHDALKEHKAKVTTIVQGFCASAATVIACAGDVRKISPNAIFLIHKCRASLWDANENVLEEELEAQRTTNDVILGIYKSVLKKDESELEVLFEANHGEGKWITAQEAVDFGFATEICDFPDKTHPATALARFLNHARELYAPAPNNNQKPNPKNMKKILISFAMLGALLDFKEDAEYDEKKGLQLSVDQLQKMEDALKELDNLKANISKNEKDLKGAQEALATAEAKIAEKDSQIETLTAERDDYKAKYENAPAHVQSVNGKDVNTEPVDVTDNPVYDELEKYL